MLYKNKHRELDENINIHNMCQKMTFIFSFAEWMSSKKTVLNIGIKLCRVLCSEIKKLKEFNIEEVAEILYFSSYILLWGKYWYMSY